MEHIIIKITKTDKTNTSLEKEVFSYIKQIINNDWRNLDVELIEIDPYSLNYCADQIANAISLEFVNIARKNVGKLINEIPEAMELLNTIELLDRFRT